MSDQESKDRILSKAAEHFLKFGFSKVTMSEIATDLGMSKKTLYTYFPGKEEMLGAIVESMQKETANRIDALVADESVDFIDKLTRLIDVSASYHSKVGGYFLLDIQRNAPHVGKGCSEFLQERVPRVLSTLLEQGIEKQIFRRDINKELVVMMYLGAFQFLLQPERQSQLPYTPRQVLEELGSVMLAGILTDEAREKYAAHSTQRRQMAYQAIAR
ncbi:MAG TPA: TetR/AcrR family transcriptional regulator [Bacteroidota bacterium]|nr:TetR/AcrR family transcriptional regulator [Bacteroidota bacterium]